VKRRLLTILAALSLLLFLAVVARNDGAGCTIFPS
jgi:hypothetical protein